MMCCHFGELKDGVAVWCPAHAGMGFGSFLTKKKRAFRFRQAQELLRKYNYVYDGVHTMISLAASFFCLRDSAHAHLTPSASN